MTWRLLAVPALITLGVTALRLYGELQRWSPALFRREPGGVGAIVGIIWLAPLFGAYFAVRLVKRGAGPASPGKALARAGAGMGLLMASGLVTVLLWPPFKVQVVVVAVVAAVAVALQFPAWPALIKTLLLYAVAARVPVVALMFLAIKGGWGTHYDAFPPGFPLTEPFERWLWGGLAVQMTLWVGNTVLLGALAGSIAARLMSAGRSGRVSAPRTDVQGAPSRSSL